jgi:hypothetical protein
VIRHAYLIDASPSTLSIRPGVWGFPIHLVSRLHRCAVSAQIVHTGRALSSAQQNPAKVPLVV